LSITPRSGGKSAVIDQLHELIRWPPRDPADPIDALYLAVADRKYLLTAEEEAYSTAAEVAESGPIDQQIADIDQQIAVLQRRAAELAQQRTEITTRHAQQRAVRQAEHDAQLQRDAFAALDIADDPLRERLWELATDLVDGGITTSGRSCGERQWHILTWLTEVATSHIYRDEIARREADQGAQRDRQRDQDTQQHEQLARRVWAVLVGSGFSFFLPARGGQAAMPGFRIRRQRDAQRLRIDFAWGDEQPSEAESRAAVDAHIAAYEKALTQAGIATTLRPRTAAHPPFVVCKAQQERSR